MITLGESRPLFSAKLRRLMWRSKGGIDSIGGFAPLDKDGKFIVIDRLGGKGIMGVGMSSSDGSLLSVVMLLVVCVLNCELCVLSVAGNRGILVARDSVSIV
jgi:hypothetical protein